MEDDDKACITGLSLGLGMGEYVPKKEKQKVNKPVASLDLVFELRPKGEEEEEEEAIHVSHNKAEGFSLKRINEGQQQQPNATDQNNKNNGCRKKLRLTKEQSAMLEESFKLHNTLNQTQKLALAEKLNLKLRQVEVWFQNRRARTKLKQTEVDYKYLKKRCENLTDENRRLKKELQELRALKVGQSPLYVQLSMAPTLTICSSCEKLLKPKEGKKSINASISDVFRNNNSQKLQNSIEIEGGRTDN